MSEKRGSVEPGPTFLRLLDESRFDVNASVAERMLSIELRDPRPQRISSDGEFRESKCPPALRAEVLSGPHEAVAASGAHWICGGGEALSSAPPDRRA